MKKLDWKLMVSCFVQDGHVEFVGETNVNAAIYDSCNKIKAVAFWTPQRNTGIILV